MRKIQFFKNIYFSRFFVIYALWEFGVTEFSVVTVAILVIEFNCKSRLSVLVGRIVKVSVLRLQLIYRRRVCTYQNIFFENLFFTVDEW